MIIADYPKLKAKFPTRQNLFNFDYQQPTEYPAEDIEKTIYNHYKNFRIAYDAEEDEENGDTECLTEWHDAFAARMQEIMQSYAPLFDTLEKVIDPFKTVDVFVDDEHQRLVDRVSENILSSEEEHADTTDRTHENEHSSSSQLNREDSDVSNASRTSEDERDRMHDETELADNIETTQESGSGSKSGSNSSSESGTSGITESETEQRNEQTNAETDNSRATTSADETVGETGVTSETNAQTTSDTEGTTAGAQYGNLSKSGTVDHRESDMPQGSIANVNDLNYMSMYTKDATGGEDNNSSINTSNTSTDVTGTSDSSTSSDTLTNEQRNGETSEQGHSESNGTTLGEIARDKETSQTDSKSSSGSMSESSSDSKSGSSQSENELSRSGSESESGSSQETSHNVTDRTSNEASTVSDIDSGAQKDENSGTSKRTDNNSTEGTETEQGTNTSHRYGYEGVPSELLRVYREGIVNYNMQIIREFCDFFMQVYV